MVEIVFINRAAFLPLVILSLQLSAQNLVPNPGFDDIISCPVDGQIRYAPPWSFIANLVIASSQGSANLFNACVPPPGLGVPVSGWGAYQPARSGNGYARVSTFGGGNNYVRNYIQAPLMQPLLKNQSYYIRFYVSPASFRADNQYFYTDAIGLGFHQSRIDSFLPIYSQPPMISVAIENSGTLLKDTLNWIKLSTCYNANGDENYVVLGSFVSDEQTIFEDQNIHQDPNYANYWIEDIFVGRFNPLPDTVLLCTGETKSLNAGFLDAIYQWSTGETDSTIMVRDPGKYIVEAILDNCVLFDSVVVIDLDESGNFSTDTIICQDEPLQLSSPVIGNYLWSDGSKNKTLTIHSIGLYVETVTNDCGQYIFSTEVNVEDCDCPIYFPNVISPNNDGINDNFQIVINCDYQYIIDQFDIFDRWGNQIYSAGEGEDINWDGKYRGKIVLNGVYVWKLNYEVIQNGKVKKLMKTGDITLL